MKRGSTGVLFIAATLAMGAPAWGGEGGPPGSVGQTGLAATAKTQLAAMSACTCRRGRWIVSSRPGFTHGRGRRLCRAAYNRSKTYGGKLGRYHPGTGRCFICYRGNVVCPPGVVPSTGTGTGRTRIRPGKDRWCKVPQWKKTEWKHDMNCRPGGGWRRYGVDRGRCFYCPPGWGFRVVRNKGYYENMVCMRVVKKRC